MVEFLQNIPLMAWLAIYFIGAGVCAFLNDLYAADPEANKLKYAVAGLMWPLQAVSLLAGILIVLFLCVAVVAIMLMVVCLLVLVSPVAIVLNWNKIIEGDSDGGK